MNMIDITLINKILSNNVLVQQLEQERLIQKQLVTWVWDYHQVFLFIWTMLSTILETLVKGIVYCICLIVITYIIYESMNVYYNK
jgi:hypothetical protein